MRKGTVPAKVERNSAIFALWYSKERTVQELAVEYVVSKASIQRILNEEARRRGLPTHSALRSHREALYEASSGSAGKVEAQTMQSRERRSCMLTGACVAETTSCFRSNCLIVGFQRADST